MAPPKKYTGDKLLIQIGDGASPETFAHDCLINQERGTQYNTQTNEEYLPDCDDPDAIPMRSLDITGLSATITGAGVMNSSSWDTWFDWWKSGEAKNVKVKENITSAAGGGTESGAYKLTSLQRTGDYKKSVTVQVTLESDGDITREANTP
jgi:hypothetical protein